MLELLAKVRISERKSKLVFEFSQRTKVPKRFIVKVRISERKSKLVLNFQSERKYPKTLHKEQISEQNIKPGNIL